MTSDSERIRQILKQCFPDEVFNPWFKGSEYGKDQLDDAIEQAVEAIQALEPSETAHSERDRLKAKASVRKFMAKYRYQYHVSMLSDLVDLIGAEKAEAVRLATPIKIMGKTLDEIIIILSALELERIGDMQMTMKNLENWMNLLRDDYRKSQDLAFHKAFERLTNQQTNEGVKS